MTLPLEGIRVLSLAQQYPGPFSTLVMADLGHGSRWQAALARSAAVDIRWCAFRAGERRARRRRRQRSAVAASIVTHTKRNHSDPGRTSGAGA